MCLGMPAVIVGFVDELNEIAEIEEAGGRRRRASLALLKGDDRPGVGDHVLVHAGLVVGCIDEEEALEMARMLEGFGELIEEEGVSR